MTVKVSLITTAKDCAEEITPFLASIALQTRPPDEVIVVDGGSTDGTREILREADGITFIEEPGANISRGRNVAVSAATHDVLALTDADCVLNPDWLERILRPIELGADVSMGSYLPIADRFLQECMAAVNLPGPEDLDEATFMPSGRSVAFRRGAIEAAGGYPEWLDIGEDMYVNHRWRGLGLDLRLARDAIVHWRLRRGLVRTWRQYFGYARGDGIAGMWPERHAVRFGAFAGLAAALGSRRRWPKAVVALAGAAYAAGPMVKAAARFDRSRDRVAAVAAVPALMALVEAAKMAGYVSGLIERRRRGN